MSWRDRLDMPQEYGGVEDIDSVSDGEQGEDDEEFGSRIGWVWLRRGRGRCLLRTRRSFLVRRFVR